uniref:Uncharacterized protein n=1 Tax=Anopheles maculatus TaxID=74869 RepID=A0A182SGU0_9DIPT
MPGEPESIPLQVIVPARVEEEETGKEEDSSKTKYRTETLDVHTIAGLITILTINIHQAESIIQLGTELGYKFWLNSVLLLISISCVYPLLVLRMLKDEGYTLNRRISVALSVLIFTSNITLQVFNDLPEQCAIFLNQQLPPTPPPSPHTTANCSVRTATD